MKTTTAATQTLTEQIEANRKALASTPTWSYEHKCSICGHVAKNARGLSAHGRKHRCPECSGLIGHVEGCSKA